MRIGLLALLLLVVASVTNAALYETVYDDSSASSKSVIIFNIVDQGFTNNGAYDWIGYDFEILSGGEFVSTTASSDTFATVNEVEVGGLLTKLEFSDGTVAPGETVKFTYDIAVDLTNGLFGVQLERHEVVVPEPATIALTVMGAGLLLRRKF